MSKQNSLGLVFVLSAPIASAGTLTLNCNGVISTSSSSNSCPPGLASAGGVIGAPGNESVGASAGGFTFASASYVTDLVIDFTGGTGAGSYVPCLDAQRGGPGGEAGASLGSVGYQASPFLGGSCGLFTMFSAELPIPFVFGVPQIQTLDLNSQAGVGSSGSAEFSGGFIVLDANRNVISSVSVSIQEVPEPRAASTILLGLALALIVRTFLCAGRSGFMK